MLLFLLDLVEAFELAFRFVKRQLADFVNILLNVGAKLTKDSC